MSEHISAQDRTTLSCSTDGHPVQRDGLCICGEVVDPSKDEIGWFVEDERGE